MTESSSGGSCSSSSPETPPPLDVDHLPSAVPLGGGHLPDNHPLRWIQRLNEQTSRDTGVPAVHYVPKDKIGRGGQLSLREIPEGYEVIVDIFRGTQRLVPKGWCEQRLAEAAAARLEAARVALQQQAVDAAIAAVTGVPGAAAAASDGGVGGAGALPSVVATAAPDPTIPPPAPPSSPS